MAYKIEPGVRQDYRGRLFRNATYPNGKVICVPYQPIGAEPAKMIPVPEEKPVRKPKALPTFSDPATGEKRKVLYAPKRLHVVERRLDMTTEVERLTGPNSWLIGLLQPLVYRTTDEEGNQSQWAILQQSQYDHHVQYHEDEEQT